ncbi:MAG: NAD(P)-dependent glycerol-3-phosphate dehydrogenase [Actinobacteria bacterium]|nr:NAD(P)-dependent glycerol-3-phosphate dehydrogenase [Actinomycetota bacterium]MBW3642464.1 NAD(P)-dependent glycerol-3-phosphate dehydrogenase [Actinomycetota bacterium]
MVRVAVIGAGAWGTTFAALRCANGPTVLWARRTALATEIDRAHTNRAYLPGAVLTPALRATADLAEAVHDVDAVAVAVPTHGFRAVLEALAADLPPGVPVVSLAKGLEQGTHKRMTEVVAEVLPGHPAGALTGPNLASEILADRPAASVLALAEPATARTLQAAFSTDGFRVYTNDDVIGCEVAGALKNVVAIAAGMADGMDLGDNARAALVTRGLAELTRLAVALGGDPRTCAGLAGLGDLVATCSSTRSRNHQLGVELGRGRTLAAIVAGRRSVIEGVGTAPVVCELGAELAVEVPIADQTLAVCRGERSPADALAALMHRRPRSELHGLAPAEGPGAAHWSGEGGVGH